MRKQPKRTALKLGATEADPQPEEQMQQPKKKKHHRKHKAEKVVNRLDIGSYEEGLKSNTGPQREKLELNIDLEQRKRAFTVQSEAKLKQKEEIVAGISLKDRVANLYSDKKETEARKVEVYEDTPSIRERAASLMAEKEKQLRKEEAVVSMTLEERKQALFNRSPSTGEQRGEAIVVDTDLNSRKQAFMVTQSKAVERTFTDKFEGPSLAERMAAFNKAPADKNQERPVIEPAMTLAERKRMLEQAHAGKGKAAPIQVGSIKGLAAKYEQSSGSEESGSYTSSSGESSDEEEVYYYGKPGEAQQDESESDENAEEEKAQTDPKEDPKIAKEGVPAEALLESVVFHYFPLYGRGETTRLLLKTKGVAFEDRTISFDQWPTEKNSGRFEFGQLPLLEIDGHKLVTSFGIESYLARKFGLYPQDPHRAYLVESIIDLKNDQVNKAVHFKFVAKDEDGLKNWAATTLIDNLKLVEARLVANAGGDGYFVGEHATWADYALFQFLHDSFYRPGSEELKVVFEAALPKLKAFVERFLEKEPGVGAYIASRPQYFA